MAGRLATFGVLCQIAVRNLVAHRLKTFIVGGIIMAGAILVVVGASLLDSVVAGLGGSIQGSIAGHIQVYSSTSKDQLALYGQMGGEPDLDAVDDFSKIKKTLETVPNVESVVPMGMGGALITSGNTIDITLERLRNAVKKRAEGDATATPQIEALKSHVRHIIQVLREDLRKVKEIADEKVIDAEDLADIERAAGDAFWADFDRDAFASLEFLENQIAPLVVDADLMFIRYIGTDLDAYAKTFERFKVVEGQMVPKGRRGILLPKFQYEEQIKLKTARRLDKIKGSLENRSMSIATDAQLQRWVHENKTQAKEILLQLDAIKTATATERLQEYLKTDEKDLGKLLAMLLDTNDQNFTDRYKAFYDLVAPLLDLYRIRVGDMLTIKAFTRTGYIQSVSVKVWGIYEFKGLEKAALAGFINLMDLVSFRDLYGYLTAEKKEEWEKMRAATGVEDVARENAEDALFGEGREVIAEATPGVIDALEQVKGSGRALRQEDLVERVYPQDEIEKGVVLNAAVILKDPKRIRQTLADIEAAAARDQVEIKALSWQDAAGVLGQFVMMLRLVLYVAVLIIFVVALVIINNAMVMATLERVREIGTLRAIGTQRAFIWRMLAVETAVVGALFGGIGAAIGAGIVQLIRAVGIPATTDVMYVFFSGPRLFPFLSTTNLIGALVIVLVVSALSAFYPAWIGMRVAPVTAMSTDD